MVVGILNIRKENVDVIYLCFTIELCNYRKYVLSSWLLFYEDTSVCVYSNLQELSASVNVEITNVILKNLIQVSHVRKITETGLIHSRVWILFKTLQQK